MPIRIRPDKNQKSQQKINKSSSSRRSSGGGIGKILLPLLVSLFKKNPKVGIALLVLGGIFYWYSTKNASSTDNSSGGVTTIVKNLLSTGLNMDEKVYDKAEVFEALADNIKNPLPEQVSLLKYAPSRKNQGQQGSCVGWASGYAARTILFSKQTGKNPNKVRFSPSYVYNQIALEDCQGAYMNNAMNLMLKKGALPYSKFAYTEHSCSEKPTSAQQNLAKQYVTKGFNRLSKGASNYKTDLLAIKQNLSQGAPVVIGMMVGGTFMSKMNGRKIWKPSKSDYAQRGFGGHAMCVIGYDDYLEGGAFQIMNSWGEEWGDDGIAWVRYNDFDHFTKEAYGLYPMGDYHAVESDQLQGELGIVLNANGKNMPLKQSSEMVFTTTQKLNKNSDFKIEMTNSMECYSYIFGEETDQSSYVLFPYTKKHSPYCGITGTRLFPKDHSLYPDDIGSKDKFALVISKQKLDYNKLNRAINKAKGNTYQEKLKQALGDELISNPNFKDGNTIQFNAKTGHQNIIGVVVEVIK